METCIRENREWVSLTGSDRIKIFTNNSEFTIYEERGKLIIMKEGIGKNGGILIEPNVSNKITIS